MELCMVSHLFFLIAMLEAVIAKPDKIFLKGYTSRSLPPGGWTAWFNADHPGGSGDYETVRNIRNHYGRGCSGLPCKKPLAMKFMNIYGFSPKELGQRVLVHPRKGLQCYDHHQANFKCDDYKVRFYCAGMDVNCRQKKSRQQDLMAAYEKPDRNMENEVLDKEESESSEMLTTVPEITSSQQVQNDFDPEVVPDVVPDAVEDDGIQIPEDNFRSLNQDEHWPMGYRWIFGGQSQHRKSRRLGPHVYDFKTAHRNNHHGPWNWRRFD